MSLPPFSNPFRPGAGHPPPYLAGRTRELAEFRRLLKQDPVLENLVLTGLRGVGKTVLLDTFKPLAIDAGWAWVGTDLSESSAVTEETIATRLMTDLSRVTSSVVIDQSLQRGVGFHPDQHSIDHRLDHHALRAIYDSTPGLVADKLKRVLEVTWALLSQTGKRGVIFAYDEAQTISDHPGKDQYPLALLLDVFQSIQKKPLPYMLVMTGLPTLFPKLVAARTFAERMFRVVFLDRLDEAESREAITKPLANPGCPVKFGQATEDLVIAASDGYPYFIQFVCRELYDTLLQSPQHEWDPKHPLDTILPKLDSDFFAGRWARATDRQRELLEVIASLESADDEFSLQEVVEESKRSLSKPFSPSHANQMLLALSESGLVYKNRHGRYSLAVPLLGQYIRRQLAQRTVREQRRRS
ncbi:MAG: AAA family ATPase [Planctomycetota bacterium]